MFLRQLTVVGLLMVALPGVAHAQAPKKLTEADVLKLVELQIEDGCIVERIELTGVDFPIDEALLSRLSKAGASDAVLAALRSQNPDAVAPVKVLTLFVQKPYSEASALHSEIFINDQFVDRFTGPTSRPIEKLMKPGWNTITMKTTTNPLYADSNWLEFRVGVAHQDPGTKEMVVDSVLWSFNNHTDWKLQKDNVHHRAAPDAKEASVEFSLYYAADNSADRKLRNGDYILRIDQDYSENPTATLTVSVNGTTLTSFLGQDRQLVITDLLRQGTNEVKIVTNRVRNGMEENNINGFVEGPAVYNPRAEKFIVESLLEFDSITGWEQDETTGLWKNPRVPDADTVEQVLTFTLDEKP